MTILEAATVDPDGGALVADTLRPLSPSSLNDLLVCERRWAYSHGVDPRVEKAPPNKHLVLGQAVHQAIRWDYEDKNPYQGIEAAIAEQVEAGGDPELALLHAESMYQAFRLWKKEHPEKPVSQEGKVEFMVGDYPVVGFVDAMFPTVGRDWKTASKAWDFKKQKDAWLQATAYAIGTGQRSWEFVVFYPDKGGASYGVHPVLVSDFDVRRFEAMVRAFGPLVQKTVIDEFPIRPGSSNWLCSEKWCSFWSVCPGGEKVEV